MALRIDAYDPDDDHDGMVVVRWKLGPISFFEAQPYDQTGDGIEPGGAWPSFFSFNESKARSACWVWMLTQEGLE